MRAALFIAFIGILSLDAGGNRACAATNGPVPLRTNFVQCASLSQEDLNDIITLAKQCGIREVAEIDTFYFIPGHSHRGILVTSPKTAAGRVSVFETLSVMCDGWSYKTRNTNAVTTFVGKFWVEGLFNPSQTHRIVSFPKAGGTNGVDVAEGISLADADKIVAALEQGRIRYTDPNIKNEADTVRVSKLKKLWTGREGGQYWLSFTDTLDAYEFTFRGDTVVFSSVVRIRV